MSWDDAMLSRNHDQSIDGLLDRIKEQYGDIVANDVGGLLRRAFETYLEELISHATDVQSGTLSLPRTPRLRVATVAVRQANMFVYTVSYARHDSWQGKEGDRWSEEYFQAILYAASQNRVDVRRIYIFEDDRQFTEPAWSSLLRRQLQKKVSIFWIRESVAEQILGKGALLNMLSSDKRIVTWQFPPRPNQRLEGAMSVAPHTIEDIHQYFCALYGCSRRLDLEDLAAERPAEGA
jgi:hypothetical protein